MSEKRYPTDMSLPEAAINLLATGYSVRDAARILNVEPSTIRHWWGADPLFKPTVDAIRQQAESRESRPEGEGDPHAFGGRR